MYIIVYIQLYIIVPTLIYNHNYLNLWGYNTTSYKWYGIFNHTGISSISYVPTGNIRSVHLLLQIKLILSCELFISVMWLRLCIVATT